MISWKLLFPSSCFSEANTEHTGRGHGFVGGCLCLRYHSMSHLAGQQAGVWCLDDVEKWSGLLKLEAPGWKQMFWWKADFVCDHLINGQRPAHFWQNSNFQGCDHGRLSMTWLKPRSNTTFPMRLHQSSLFLESRASLVLTQWLWLVISSQPSSGPAGVLAIALQQRTQKGRRLHHQADWISHSWAMGSWGAGLAHGTNLFSLLRFRR